MIGLSQREKDIHLEIVVRPNSNAFSVETKDGQIRVCVEAPADKNKANKELLNKLKKLFERPIEIISGAKTRRKTVKVYDATTEEIKAKISRAAK